MCNVRRDNTWQSSSLCRAKVQQLGLKAWHTKSLLMSSAAKECDEKLASAWYKQWIVYMVQLGHTEQCTKCTFHTVYSEHSVNCTQHSVATMYSAVQVTRCTVHTVYRILAGPGIPRVGVANSRPPSPQPQALQQGIVAYSFPYHTGEHQLSDQ